MRTKSRERSRRAPWGTSAVDPARRTTFGWCSCFIVEKDSVGDNWPFFSLSEDTDAKTNHTLRRGFQFTLYLKPLSVNSKRRWQGEFWQGLRSFAGIVLARWTSTISSCGSSFVFDGLVCQVCSRVRRSPVNLGRRQASHSFEIRIESHKEEGERSQSLKRQ